VKSYHQVLSNLAISIFRWKSILKVKAPPRVVFFVWMAALGKILTLDNLRKMNIIVMEWCCLCKICGESMDNLLLHCEVAIQLIF
jgi:hypothetical protein